MKTFLRLKLTLLAAALWLSADVSATTNPPATLPALNGIRRIVFLGDSITYSGQYIDYLDAYLTTRFPDQRWELLDLGLPSETVSGLSEPGHAGGKFPRPDLHERLDRVLAKTKPDLVVACYGMNCGIYHPFSEERFKKYQAGIQRLRAKVLASGAKILHITPPTFDPVPIKAKVLPPGREVYEQPFEGYNQVLDRYSEWLLGQRKLGWDVVDLHRVMNRHLAERRKTEPSYILAKDGVHANATGHWLIAQEVLRHWKAPADVDTGFIDIEAAPGSSSFSSNITLISVVRGSFNTIRAGFSMKTRRPMPKDVQWDSTVANNEEFNLLKLVVKGAELRKCQLFVEAKPLGEFSGEQLAKGVNLAELYGLSIHLRGAELLKLIRQNGRILSDAWLTECGHLRPGMKQGLPVVEAQRQTQELSVKIHELTAPVTLQLGVANYPPSR